jgi:hypothetical protein
VTASPGVRRARVVVVVRDRTPGRNLVLGLDGKLYPRPRLGEHERDMLNGRVHYLSHAERLSVRAILAVLAEQHNIHRSVGWVVYVLKNWTCVACSGGANETPEHAGSPPPPAVQVRTSGSSEQHGYGGTP